MMDVTLAQQVYGQDRESVLTTDSTTARWLIAHGYAYVPGDESDKVNITESATLDAVLGAPAVPTFVHVPEDESSRGSTITRFTFFNYATAGAATSPEPHEVSTTGTPNPQVDVQTFRDGKWVTLSDNRYGAYTHRWGYEQDGATRKYRFVATNSEGTATSAEVTLTVGDPDSPAESSAPVFQLAPSPSTGTVSNFSTLIDGPDITVAWAFNKTPALGAGFSAFAAGVFETEEFSPGHWTSSLSVSRADITAQFPAYDVSGDLYVIPLAFAAGGGAPVFGTWAKWSLPAEGNGAPQTFTATANTGASNGSTTEVTIS